MRRIVKIEHSNDGLCAYLVIPIDFISNNRLSEFKIYILDSNVIKVMNVNEVLESAGSILGIDFVDDTYILRSWSDFENDLRDNIVDTVKYSLDYDSRFFRHQYNVEKKDFLVADRLPFKLCKDNFSLDVITNSLCYKSFDKNGIDAASHVCQLVSRVHLNWLTPTSFYLRFSNVTAVLQVTDKFMGIFAKQSLIGKENYRIYREMFLI